MSKIPFSFSRLSTFEQCPKQFYHLNIAKDVPFKESPEMLHGKRVHKHFENRIKIGKSLPDDLKRWEGLIAGLEAKVKAQGKQLTAEHKLALDWNHKPVDYFAKSVAARSVSDVLAPLSSGMIIDWKTGKPRDKDEEQMYLTAAMEMIADKGLQRLKAVLVYTKHKTHNPVELERGDAMRVYDGFRMRADKINEAHEIGDWKAKPTALCKWCPVPKQMCPHKE